MKQLKHFRRLERLDLSNSAVTDSDLAGLPSLRHLRALDLSGTEISNVGLGQLKRHTGLRLVRIANTRVTDRGVAELVGQLPNSEITTRALVVPATDSYACRAWDACRNCKDLTSSTRKSPTRGSPICVD